ncbi:hypothetical protein PG990_008124 [Apiospora arundinis]
MGETSFTAGPPGYAETLSDASRYPVVDDPTAYTAAGATSTSSATNPNHAAAEEVPPDYARDDPIAHTFALRGPFVYLATDDDHTGKPRYQLAWTNLHNMQFRPLRPGESAKVLQQQHADADEGHPATKPAAVDDNTTVEYDEETTLYVIDLATWVGQIIEIRGRHPRCLPGHIKLEKRLLPFGFGSSAPLFKFYYVTRPASQDFLKPENEQQLRRYGYDPGYEMREKLMFTVQPDGRKKKAGGLIWKYDQGKAVASEVDEKMRLLDDEMTLQLREALLACWICVVRG